MLTTLLIRWRLQADTQFFQYEDRPASRKVRTAKIDDQVAPVRDIGGDDDVSGSEDNARAAGDQVRLQEEWCI